MTQEALKLALEAIEFVHDTGDTQTFDMCYAKPALAAIKEALAQPEQEPVAWVCYGAPGKRDIDFEEADINGLPIGTSLYTSSPQRKPLTLGQKQRLWSSVGDKPTLKDRVNAYGLAIEAAHGINE